MELKGRWPDLLEPPQGLERIVSQHSRRRRECAWPDLARGRHSARRIVEVQHNPETPSLDPSSATFTTAGNGTPDGCGSEHAITGSLPTTIRTGRREASG
jgi:hypothetical protein